MEIRGILIFIFMCLWLPILALIMDIAFSYEGETETKNAKQALVLLTISELLLLYLINNWQ